MAQGELKHEALAAIQAGRRELGAEAEWIRRSMNPKTVARRMAREHTAVVLAGAFSVGVALSLLFLHKWDHRDEPRPAKPRHDHTRSRKRAKADSDAVKIGLGAYLGGLALKATMPLLMEGGLKVWRHWLSTRKQAGDAPHAPRDSAVA
jgi:hypothetical protein